MMMSVVCAVAKDCVDSTGYHAEIDGPCCHHPSCLGGTITGMGASSAELLMTADSQLGMKDIEGFCDNLCPHPNPQHQKK